VRAVSEAKCEAARDCIRTAMKIAGGTPTIGWSGGKDGLVAGMLAGDIGIREGCCDESFYFRRQREDIYAVAAKLGFNITYYNRLTYKWLAGKQDCVFPYGDPDASNRFCEYRQRTTMRVHAKAIGASMVITGRKTKGNSVRAPIYRSQGVVMCHPIHDWLDADVWGFLQQRGVAEPWVYSTPLGRWHGNTPWMMYRQSESVEEN
jgi:3'-phosphoadenosine 5'-phosphosulfate sulfotransferase (PAPS reductase)/FAD synthetase